MRRLKNPVVIVAAVGLLLGWALPTLAQSGPLLVSPAPGVPLRDIGATAPAVECPGCTANNPGMKAACNQCGGASIGVGSNCDVCCAGNYDCQLKSAEGANAPTPISRPAEGAGQPTVPVR